jgi:hypothetical protein
LAEVVQMLKETLTAASVEIGCPKR